MGSLNHAQALAVCWEGENALVLQENSILSLLDMSSHRMLNAVMRMDLNV